MYYSGVILAGGNSQRMGHDKRYLNIKGRPLIVWVAEQLAPLVDELLIVTSEDTRLPESLFSPLKVRVVTDYYPGRGVLAGMHAGLVEAQGEWAYVIGGDMPFLNQGLLKALARIARHQETAHHQEMACQEMVCYQKIARHLLMAHRSDSHSSDQATLGDVIVPRWRDNLEPLHALYRPATCAPAAEAALLQNKRRIISFYPAVQVRILEEHHVACWDPDGDTFFNVNTPEAWDIVLEREKERTESIEKERIEKGALIF